MYLILVSEGKTHFTTAAPTRAVVVILVTELGTGRLSFWHLLNDRTAKEQSIKYMMFFIC
jgi:hypothetical protein